MFATDIQNELLEIAFLKYNVDSEELLPESTLQYIQNYQTKIKTESTVIRYEFQGKEFSGNFVQIYDTVLTQNPTANFAMNGAVFDDSPSAFNNYLASLKIKRKKEKNLMFEAGNRGDTKLKNLYKFFQLNTKELMNSLYGLLNLDSFPLYSVASAGAITGTCQSQLQDLIIGHETVLGGRVIFRSINELIGYVTKNRLLTEVPDFNTYFGTEKPNELSDEELVTKLVGWCEFVPDDHDKATIKELVKSTFVVNSNRVRFYYLNNLKEFINDSTLFFDYIEADTENILSPKDFNHKQLDLGFAPFLEAVRDIVFPKWIHPDSDALCRNYQRTTCLMSD